jgi:hypothetical protein
MPLDYYIIWLSEGDIGKGHPTPFCERGAPILSRDQRKRWAAVMIWAGFREIWWPRSGSN